MPTNLKAFPTERYFQQNLQTSWGFRITRGDHDHEITNNNYWEQYSVHALRYAIVFFDKSFCY